MAATTTPSIKWALPQIKAHLPEVNFVKGSYFSWSPTTQTITYSATSEDAIWQLLHEAGHAICQHDGYKRDIELLGYEVDAWTAAKRLASKLELTIPHDTVEDHIDSYRDWLHARSQCTACAQTGIQISSDTYRCVHCPTIWRVNDSRQCGLRRYEV